MRLLIYNIAYGTGTDGGIGGILSAHRYLRTQGSHLDSIAEFIAESGADVVGLVEVDTGSFRTGFKDQTSVIAKKLLRHRYCAVKYGMDSIGRNIPILRKQANAFLTLRESVQTRTFYMPFGFKRLVIELQMEGVRFLLVHLALKRETRKKQLEYIAKLAAMEPGPVIIAGDFNAFSGTKEILKISRDLDLYDPNTEDLPTFPSASPRVRLDFILCSRDVKKLNFEVPQVAFSDHLPLIFDFEII